jgi:cytosine permease
VVVAGWNVASPTLYRAGLALQVATPNWSRWRVTLVVGAGMIICACIPALITHLDLLVTANALVILPLGAFIFIDIWLFPKIGLLPNLAEKTGSMISWPAAAAWILATMFSIVAWVYKDYDPVFPIFLVLPEWIVSVALYIILSFVQQKTLDAPESLIAERTN